MNFCSRQVGVIARTCTLIFDKHRKGPQVGLYIWNQTVNFKFKGLYRLVERKMRRTYQRQVMQCDSCDAQLRTPRNTGSAEEVQVFGI